MNKKSYIYLLLFVYFIFEPGVAKAKRLAGLIPESAAEHALLEDAKDRHLDDFDLADAAIIASGAAPSLQKILRQSLEKKIAPIISLSSQIPDPLKRAHYVLNALHRRILTHYQEGASTLDLPLTTGIYNCLSSALLYNIIAKRVGLEVGAMVLPTHVFSLVNIAGRIIEVETTTRNGFNPKRKGPGYVDFLRSRGLVPQFVDKLGHTQDSDIEDNKPHVIDNVTLLSLIYSNRGVEEIRKNRVKLARAFFTRSRQLAEPRRARHMQRMISVSINYMAQKMMQKGQYLQAKQQLKIAIDESGDNPPSYLRHNYAYCVNHLAIAAHRARDDKKAEALLLDGLHYEPENQTLKNNLALVRGRSAQQGWFGWFSNKPKSKTSAKPKQKSAKSKPKAKAKSKAAESKKTAPKPQPAPDPETAKEAQRQLLGL